MNDLLAHEQYVREHLDDRTAARSLVDHHQEALNVSRRVALRAVAAIRKQQRDAEEMAAAAERMRPETVGSVNLRYAVLDCFDYGDNDPSFILLRPGSRPPARFSCVQFEDGGQFTYTSITVGARWILNKAEEFDRDCASKYKVPDDFFV